MGASDRRGTANSRGGGGGGGGVGMVWFVALLFITGSFCLSLVQMSKGLHDQLISVKQQLYETRQQLVEIGVEKETLLENRREESKKVGILKSKSSLISEELLGQQQQLKALQYEVLASKQDLTAITHNCTESSRLMEKQFNVTMRYLMDRVINNRECHSLLQRDVKEHVKLERSVELLQNKVYNLTQQLTLAKSSLFKASKSLKQSKADVETLKDRLVLSNDALRKTQQALTNAQAQQHEGGEPPAEG
ncbi:Hypothetical Protein FCC1311_069122 [Hondaea fermentalgiana]|uniref:Uncharacterized protein n=1 Tax=Hondaea fermentalgiana TaxID=2315210 RepID=A0A2R5GIH5_9STRA|nr:Hypothetical Protein FCC1311_069122 [Hondaea fermentalgiana]|eukprot:GBG30692.1 Hypothetical Protein FCC1311_069122 [Hondaea fermentalgiana]